MDTLGLEVGYRLIALVDKNRQGDLLGRIKFDFGPLKVKGTGDVRDQSF